MRYAGGWQPAMPDYGLPHEFKKFHYVTAQAKTGCPGAFPQTATHQHQVASLLQVAASSIKKIPQAATHSNIRSH